MRAEIEQQLQLVHASCEKKQRCTTPTSSKMCSWLKTRVECGTTISPFPGLYARAEYWKTLNPSDRAMHVIRALSYLHPEWVFCFTSAAVIHGFEVAFPLLNDVHILSSHAGVRAGITMHAFIVAPEDIECVNGVRVTSALRTAFDCARCLSFPFGLAIADSALRGSGASSMMFSEYINDIGGGLRGVARARVVAIEADPRSENGGETYARAIMREHGVCRPELQVVYQDWFNLGRAMRVDFLWRMKHGLDVAGELDGKDKIVNDVLLHGSTSIDALRAERQRESRLTKNVRVARFTYQQVRAVQPLLHILSEYGVPATDNPQKILRPYEHMTSNDVYVHLR